MDPFTVNVLANGELYAHIATHYTVPRPNQIWGHYFSALMDWDLSLLPLEHTVKVSCFVASIYRTVTTALGGGLAE